jgi:pyruvate/2-oxoglutarate dehydrogenase complex dihydrolipoamide acyltransferase (E2) component
MTKCLPFIEKLSRESGVKITPTHLVGFAVAQAMREVPGINGMIRGKRLYLRKHIDLFFQVHIPRSEHSGKKSEDLAGAIVRKAENLSVIEIAQELHQKADRVRLNQDAEVKRGFDIIKWIPWSLTGWFLDLMSFLIYGLNLNLGFLGIPRDPFGSVMITNVGSFGVELAWTPLVPWSRIPLLLTMCHMKEKPIVVNGQIKVAPMLPISVTFDHRFMDGAQAAAMCRVFLKCFNEPEKYLAVGSFDHDEKLSV